MDLILPGEMLGVPGDSPPRPLSRSRPRREIDEKTETAPGGARDSTPTPPSLSELDDELRGLIPLSTRNETLLKEVLESYLLEKYQQSPTTASSSSGRGRKSTGQGKATSRAPGKARREVIASLYMQRQQPRKKASKVDILRLPPWENNSGVSYALEEDALDRQEQVRELYSVRNVGISVAAACRPSSTPASMRRQARPPISDDDISLDGTLEKFYPSPPLQRAPRIQQQQQHQQHYQHQQQQHQLQQEPRPTAPAGPSGPTVPTAPTAPASSRSRFQRPVPPSALVPAPSAAPASAPAAAKRAFPSTPQVVASKTAPSSPKHSVGQKQQPPRGSPLHTPGFLVAPPAQPEDIVGLCADIIMRVADKLIRCFSEALEFADDHKETIREAQTRKDAAASGEHKHGEPNINSGNNNSLELDTQPVVARILNRLGAQQDNQSRPRRRDGRDNNNNNGGGGGGDESDAEGDARSVGTASVAADLTRSQSSFKRAMELLICIPNHRPAPELCTILLWLLSCGSAPPSPESDDRMHADILASKNMLSGFENHIYRITEILAQVPERDSQRSGGKMQAATDLRGWIVDRFQVLQETPAAIAASSAAAAAASANSFAFFTSASAGAGFEAPPVARKPQFNGPIKRLGREYKEYRELSGVEPSGADEEYPTLLLPPPTSPFYKPAEEAPAAVPRNTRKVRLHMGMFDFSTAMKWLDTPVLLEEGNARGGARIPISDAVLPPLLASHHEKPSSLSALSATTTTTPVQPRLQEPRSASHTDMLQRSDRKRNLLGHAEAREQAAHTAPEMPDHGHELSSNAPATATLDVERAFSLSQSSFSQFTSTFVPPTPVEREMAFFRLAPALTPGQRSLILNAFIVDLAQAVLLNVSVLCRHAWAGKQVTPADLLALFGKPVVRLIGKKILGKLLEWLIANRRTDCSFKSGNPTLTDLALQRMFSYWPQLTIQLNPTPRARRPAGPKRRDKEKEKEGEEKKEKKEEERETEAEKGQENQKEKHNDRETKVKEKGKKDKDKDKDKDKKKEKEPRKPHSGDSRPNSRPSSRAGSRPNTADVGYAPQGSHAVIATYTWSDPYRVSRIFKEPHLFVPNVCSV